MASYYYSGQGSLYVAQRNTDGTPQGFVGIGNVPSLELAIEITKFDHKESESGNRAVDLTIVQEKNGTFNMTMESITPANLALGFWGETESQATGALSDFVVTARVAATDTDYRVPLMDPNTGDSYAGLTFTVGADTIGDDATPTVTYQFGTTEGDLTNSKNGYVDEKNGVLVIFNTAKQTSRGATVNITDAQALYCDIAVHGSSVITHAFTQSSQERWMRFEGLNTIDDKTVIIDIFKASLDPLTGYGLINEELSQLEISGSCLYDSLQPGVSKFFRQMNVA